MKLRLLPLLLFIGIGTLILAAALRADGAEGPYYVVSVGTGKYWVVRSSNSNETIDFSQEEIARDWAEALNEAHERRHTYGMFIPDDPGSGLRPEISSGTLKPCWEDPQHSCVVY